MIQRDLTPTHTEPRVNAWAPLALSTPPGRDWTVVRTSKVAIQVLAGGGVTNISFDHDLGGGDNAMLVG